MESTLVNLSAFAGEFISDNSEIPPDITFKFAEAGGEATEVSAHKMILAMVSQPFRYMFFGHNTMDMSANVMDIEDTTKPTFQIMIDAIYNVKSIKESLRDKTVHEIFAVLHIVTKYKISVLELAVKEALSTFPFTEDNIIEVANQAMETYSTKFNEAVQELLLAAAKFLQSNFSDDDSFILFVVKNSDHMATVHKLTVLMLALPPTASSSPTTCYCYGCKKELWHHYFMKPQNSNHGSTKNKSECVADKNSLPNPTGNEKRKSRYKKRARKIPKGNNKQVNKENLSARLKKKQGKDDFGSDCESEEEIKNQKQLMTQLRKLFKENIVPLKPRAPTRGDGNCFFRSMADQILVHKIPDKPKTHQALRLAVCNHIKNLPPAVLQNTVNVVFKGKRQGLTSLACRQRKRGQFVDDNGVMVMATALFLGRNIEVYSENALHESTKIDGGEDADQLPPLTIFYFRDYQHYQSVVPM